MGRKSGTKKERFDDVDIPKLIYEVICVGLVIGAIIYAIVTGTAPDNSGY